MADWLLKCIIEEIFSLIFEKISSDGFWDILQTSQDTDGNWVKNSISEDIIAENKSFYETYLLLFLLGF